MTSVLVLKRSELMLTSASSQNLVARGENQKPIPGSSGAETTPGYDASGQPMLGNPMDPSGESATEFGYPVGPSAGGDF